MIEISSGVTLIHGLTRKLADKLGEKPSALPPVPNPFGAWCANLFRVGTLYFCARSSEEIGTEPWKSDGTAAGTVLAANVNPGSGEAYPTNLTVSNGSLYFTTTNGTSGIELYRYYIWTAAGSEWLNVK